jgi:hypothetical protein
MRSLIKDGVLKASDCIIKTKNKSIFNKRYTIGMCIDIKGNIDFTIIEKALKSIKFNKFMNKINKNNKVIFMDNATTLHPFRVL